MKQAYEAVSQVLRSATNQVQTVVRLVVGQKKAVDRALPTKEKSRDRKRSLSDPPLPKLEHADPHAARHTRRRDSQTPQMFIVSNGDNTVPIKVPKDYKFSYEGTSDDGEVLQLKAIYCPSKNKSRDRHEDSRSKKFLSRVGRALTWGSREDHTPFRGLKQRIRDHQRDMHLVIHLPSETYAFVPISDESGIKVQEIKQSGGKLGLLAQTEESGKHSELTASLKQFQPLVNLSISSVTPHQTGKGKRRKWSTISALGKCLPGAQKHAVAPAASIRGIWKETHESSKFSIFSMTRAIP